MTSRTLLVGAALSVCALTAHATDLLQVWQAARQHDPQGRVIDAGRAASAQQREQIERLRCRYISLPAVWLGMSAIAPGGRDGGHAGSFAGLYVTQVITNIPT